MRPALRQSAHVPYGGSAADPNRKDTTVGEIPIIEISACSVYCGFVSVSFFPHIDVVIQKNKKKLLSTECRS